MQPTFTQLLSRRYAFSKKRSGFLSFISFASIIGVALGVMVLITVLSVMNGFESALKSRILGVAPHAIVQGTKPIQNWQSQRDALQNDPDITQVTPFVTIQGLLKQKNYHRFSVVQGVKPEDERSISILEEFMVEGSLNDLTPGKYGIIIGEGIAAHLGVLIGDTITLMVLEGNRSSPFGLVPTTKRFTVRGIFSVKASEIDGNMALIHLQDAQKILRIGDAVSGLRLQFRELFLAPNWVTKQYANPDYQMIKPGQYALDWTKTHGNLFQAIQLEKRLMFLMLMLIIAVAAFNIISSLVMLVNDKRSDIAILRTMGATKHQIMMIFVRLGTLQGLMGVIIGTVLGILLAINVSDIVRAIESLMGQPILQADVYFIDYVPSELHLIDVVQIAISAFILCLLATLYPARAASKIEPAEALRYE